MPNIYVNINGRELRAHGGQSILDVAARNGIEIPTLCHDERVKAFGACGVCLVEVEGMPRLARACSTMASDGMAVRTDTERARAARTTALEFMLSDHAGDCRPPCVTACPAQTDCQGYVGLIANGEFKEANKLIKDVLPLPASIGRVCPHPCEDACRRELVEEPISIARLKAFAADMDLEEGEGGAYMPDVLPDTGKRVAVIGGGPGGLSAAYYLRRLGHRVAVYDAMGKMGGMLRYGIPEYRLPKAVLDAEVSLIERLGVEMVNGAKVGEGISFEAIRSGHDATVVAIGAWTSAGLRCPGDDLPGVVGGIDFLREVALGGKRQGNMRQDSKRQGDMGQDSMEQGDMGQDGMQQGDMGQDSMEQGDMGQDGMRLDGLRVAVIGGGNTAMDACRTAVRLGAAEVNNIYRRTKAEMPAEEAEILEAEEEGVVFRYLVNPIKILPTADGRVGQIRLQKMCLGEPDQSGRRAPVPIEGEEETLDADMAIVAIGQGVDPGGLEGLALTRRRTVVADEATFRTNIEGVFAIGDATNKGAGIAIEAIGEARRAAGVIDGYLRGVMAPFAEPFIVKREMTAEDFADRLRIGRERARCQEPGERKGNFEEVSSNFAAGQAMAEAKRCLECGCADYFECKLVKYARQYGVRPEKYEGGQAHSRPMDESNPFIHRNPDKCILCGLCVRVCDEVMGLCALGFASRGFDTAVQPEFGRPLAETDCVSCGQCAALCPTGALVEALPITKPVPTAEKATRSVCPFCGVGCGIKLASVGGMLLRSLPDDSVDKTALLCAKGRFGFGDLQMRRDERITEALVREGGVLAASGLDEAIALTARRALEVAARHGAGALAVAVSDRYTNEEIFVVRRYATEVLGTGNVYCLNGVASGLKDVFGDAASTNTLDELAHTDAIVLFCEDVMASHTVAGIKIKQAVENGAKLILASNLVTQADEWAAAKLTPGESLGALKAMAAELVAMGKRPANAHGFEEFARSLADTEGDDCSEAGVDGAISSEAGADGAIGTEAGSYSGAIEAARIYGGAKKAMFVFDQKALTRDAARLIAGIAAIVGHVGRPRAGVIALLPNCNSQGMVDMGVDPDGAALAEAVEEGRVKGLLVFGEDMPGLSFGNLEFLMASDCLMTETAKMADVVLPAATAAESNGTYTGTDRTVRLVRAAQDPLCGLENWQVAQKLANATAAAMGAAADAIEAADGMAASPAKAFRYENAAQIRRDISAFSRSCRGMGELDLSGGGACVPFGKSRVLHQDGFAFADGKARLAVPEGDALFTRSPNTHGALNSNPKTLSRAGS